MNTFFNKIKNKQQDPTNFMEINNPEDQSNIKTFSLFDNLLHFRLIKLSQTDFPKLKLIDENGEEYITNSIFLKVNNKKIKEMHDITILDFYECDRKEIINCNKIYLLIRYYFKDNLIINQIVTNIYSYIYCAHIDDNYFFCFFCPPAWNLKQMEKKRIIGDDKFKLQLPKNQLKIDMSKKISDAEKYDCIVNNYITDKQLEGKETYDDIFKFAKKVHTNTIDSMYIKNISKLTKNLINNIE